MSSVLFTVDELRALRRVADVELPGFVVAGDTGQVAVDAAALRGLAVRDLVSFGGGSALDDLRVGAELTRLLAPFTSARLLAEVEMESAGRLGHVALAVGAEGPATLLSELPAGLVEVERVAADPRQVLARVCRVDEVAESGTGPGFTVAARAQADADGLVLDGAPEAAVRLLTNAGVDADSARAWVAAVAGRRYAASVSVAHRFRDGGPIAAGELRWLVAGDGTTWRVEPAAVVEAPAAPPVASWPDLGAPEYAMIAPRTRRALYDDLAALVERTAASATSATGATAETADR